MLEIMKKMLIFLHLFGRTHPSHRPIEAKFDESTIPHYNHFSDLTYYILVEYSESAARDSRNPAFIAFIVIAHLTSQGNKKVVNSKEYSDLKSCIFIFFERQK